jgi:transposase-like protein
MIEMYFHGVSTRKVSAVVEELCGTTISASEVSALTRKLDTSLTAWRERRLTDTPYPALVVDAHVEQVRREGHVRSTAALWVVGITPDGYREHLGVWLGPSESEASCGSRPCVPVTRSVPARYARRSVACRPKAWSVGPTCAVSASRR